MAQAASDYADPICPITASDNELPWPVGITRMSA
jgi:hypothetical protein